MQKQKPKLISFIVLLVIAIGFAIGGGVYMATYQSGWPIKVESRITFTQTYDNSGRYTMGGRIKNVSNETIVIDSNTFTLTYSAPNNGSRSFSFSGYRHGVEYYFGTVELAPGEVLDLSGMPTLDDEITVINSSMKSFTMTVNGNTYNLTTGNTVAIILFIGAGTFALIAVCVLIASLNAAKAQNKVVEYAANNVENAMIVSGTLTMKKDAAKNIGKSIASVMGGALSAAFLGFGAYRIYGTGLRCNFILGADKIYAYNQADKKPSAEKAVVIDNAILPQANITTKNNNVTLKAVDKSITITFNTKGSGYSADEVSNRLNQMFTATNNTNAVEEGENK